MYYFLKISIKPLLSEISDVFVFINPKLVEILVKIY